jgi:hypothetical protein
VDTPRPSPRTNRTRRVPLAGLRQPDCHLSPLPVGVASRPPRHRPLRRPLLPLRTAPAPRSPWQWGSAHPPPPSRALPPRAISAPSLALTPPSPPSGALSPTPPRRSSTAHDADWYGVRDAACPISTRGAGRGGGQVSPGLLTDPPRPPAASCSQTRSPERKATSPSTARSSRRNSTRRLLGSSPQMARGPRARGRAGPRCVRTAPGRRTTARARRRFPPPRPAPPRAPDFGRSFPRCGRCGCARCQPICRLSQFRPPRSAGRTSTRTTSAP